MLSGRKAAGSASFAKAKSKASEYAGNPVKLITLIEAAAKKAESRKGALADAGTFLRMLKAFVNHEYTAIPRQSLVLIVASLVYFVMPADFIPDFILGLGFIDDAALLGWTLRAVKSDVDDFRQWESRITKESQAAAGNDSRSENQDLFRSIKIVTSNCRFMQR